MKGPMEGALLKLGLALPLVKFPKTVNALWGSRVAATVPLVVTAALGVELSTTPSPVNVTLVTVPQVAVLHSSAFTEPLPNFASTPLVLTCIPFAVPPAVTVKGMALVLKLLTNRTEPVPTLLDPSVMVTRLLLPVLEELESPNCRKCAFPNEKIFAALGLAITSRLAVA
jgi:hypothetical protein